MEKILVGMDPEKTSLWAAVHALNLAKRINARVYFLLVIDPEVQEKKGALRDELETFVKDRLEFLIEEGLSDGISVDYYVTHGQYDNELVKFVKENRITLLVVSSPTDSYGHSDDFNDLLEKIRHRIDCRIEVVHKRTLKRTKK